MAAYEAVSERMRLTGRRFKYGVRGIAGAWAATGLLLGVLGGCARRGGGEAVPRYPAMSGGEAVRVLAVRARDVRTVSAEGLLTMTRPDGESVRLDAVMVMEPPGKVRVRAWKFGQAVFDLTLNEDGLYLVTMDDPSRAAQLKRAGVSAGQLARAWGLLSGGFFDSPKLVVTEEGRVLRVRGESDGRVVVCEVDRATLTPRRYVMLDDQGRERFTLTLDRYRTEDGGVAWPGRLTARSESGQVVVEYRDVELNGELAPGAFVPPKRAERLP